MRYYQKGQNQPNKYLFIDSDMQNLSSELKVFIMSLLEKSYLFRSTAAKALKDVWMTKGKKKNLKNIHKKNAIARLNNYEVFFIVSRLIII